LSPTCASLAASSCFGLESNVNMWCRTSIDWECVRYKAAEIIVDLVYRTPELKDLIFMPAGRIKPYTVLPIGFGFPYY
jgi:hypothetical protein